MEKHRPTKRLDAVVQSGRKGIGLARVSLQRVRLSTPLTPGAPAWGSLHLFPPWEFKRVVREKQMLSRFHAIFLVYEQEKTFWSATRFSPDDAFRQVYVHRSMDVDRETSSVGFCSQQEEHA